MKLTKEEIYQRVASKKLSGEQAAALLRKSRDEYDGSFSLSTGQKGIWISQQQSPTSTFYNVPVAFRIKQEIKLRALEQALESLLLRHEILRIGITIDGEETIQRVNDSYTFSIRLENVVSLEEDAVLQRIKEDSQTPFNLEEAPLMRASLYTWSEDHHILLLCFHHIIVDGISLITILKELDLLYAKEAEGRSVSLENSYIQYRDYVRYQRKWLESEEGEASKAYWINKFKGDFQDLDFPYVTSSKLENKKYHGDTYSFAVNKQTTRKLKELADERQTSIFTIMLSAYTILLHKYSGQDELMVGTPVSGRPDRIFSQTIGFFANMLALKSDIQLNPAFTEFVKTMHQQIINALEHANFPYTSLIEQLRKDKENQSMNLFKVSFSFQNWFALHEFGESSTLFVDPLSDIHQMVEYDLAFEVFEVKGQMNILLKYNELLLNREMVQRLAEHYNEILKSISQDPSVPISEINLLTEAEKHRLLIEWNSNEMEWPHTQCVHESFEEQALKTPHATAVIFKDTVLTYKELNDKANMLAYYLTKEGIGRGDFVGIFQQRSQDMLVSILAILKAGAAYVPLDPIYPENRLAYMIEETNITIILTHQTLNRELPGYRGRKLFLDSEWSLVEKRYTAEQGCEYRFDQGNPNDIVYVLYTSGSTGKPKGVQVLHKGLTNVLWFKSKERPGFKSTDRMMAIFTLCFDMSVIEMFLPIINGGSVEILPEEYLNDGFKLKEVVESGRITFIQATPATCQLMLSAGWNKKVKAKLLLGGDKLTPELAEKLLGLVDEVWNGWGPTETSIYNANGLITSSDHIHIGRPYANNSFYILDKHLNPVPIGVIGEAYIGGVQVSAGYLNRPELNQANFLKNPFNKDENSMIYKTGDLVRYLPDGKIDIIGRSDRMVKLRGYRIELAEVEAALQAIEEIDETIVLVREDEFNKRALYAFLKRNKKHQKPDFEKVKRTLKKHLPNYMIPTRYLLVECFPLTASLKLNRKYLMEEKIAKIIEEIGEKEAAARNVLEMNTVARDRGESMEKIILKKLQQSIINLVADTVELDANSIDIHTNIEEYGLDSISVTTLLLKLKNMYKIEISPGLFFEYSTIDKFSKYLMNVNFEKVWEAFQVKENHEDQTQPVQGEAEDLTHVEALTESNTNLIIEHQDSDMAIIGASLKMPGSNTLAEFWENLLAGRNLITEAPQERWGKLKSDSIPRWGAFLDGIEYFDTEFFNIAKQEAELLDPQIRLLLENTWELLEEAGLKLSNLNHSRVGLFVGLSNLEYMNVLKQNGKELEAHHPMFSSPQGVANYIAKFFNLKGPSVVINTDFSSSFVALHQAKLAIKSGDCDVAIVAGANLILDPMYHDSLNQLGMLSNEDKNKVLDQSSHGYVRGEGVGTVLLKPLKQAIADGNNIHAVLKGTSINHSGENSSYSSISESAVEELLVAAYSEAKLDPRTINYLELHGSSTLANDLKEINAIKQAFRNMLEPIESNRPFNCGLGCVKSNFGNLEGASGMAGLFKVIMALKNKQIPATIHIEKINPYLELEGTPFYIVQSTQEWMNVQLSDKDFEPRRAGISSFGMCGTNVHVIIEEYVEDHGTVERGVTDQHVFPLSAKSEQRLKQYAQKLSDYLIRERCLPLENIAYTLQSGREELDYRVAIVAKSQDDLISKLTHFYNDQVHPDIFVGYPKEALGAMNRLFEGEEGQEFLSKLSKSKNVVNVAQLWSVGARVDWGQYFSERLPKKIHLPAAPFIRTRHWIDQKQTEEALGNSPLKVLRVDSIPASTEFINRWKNVHKTESLPFRSNIDVVQNYITSQTKGNLIHMLVQLDNGKKMEVVMSGKGKTILLISGFGLTAASFYRQFEEWSSEYQVINIHIPGIGLSDPDSEVSLAKISEQFVEVLSKLGVSFPIHVVAICWGGMIGQTFAALHPEKTATLTLCNSFSNWRVTNMAKLEGKIKEDFEDLNFPDHYSIFYNSHCLNPNATSYLIEVFTGEGFSTTALLPNITAPTLITSGNRDLVIDHDETKLLYSEIPQSELFEIDGGGHGVFMTHADLFNKTVLKFIKKYQTEGKIVSWFKGLSG